MSTLQVTYSSFLLRKNIFGNLLSINKNKNELKIAIATLVTTTNYNSNNIHNKFSKLKFYQPQQQRLLQKNDFLSLKNKQFTILQKNNYATLVTHEITKNLTIFSDKPRNVDKDRKTLQLKEQIEKPLVVMFAWMLATKKNLAKYVQIYADQGFDVLTVEITPWQLLWPVKGAQVVAFDVLKFLENNPLYRPLVIHGFSVGGYVWSEVMVHMTKDPERYKPIINRINAQIWDSVADITEIPIGVPKAIFPRNQTLQKALRNYTIYHLKTFNEQATCHYIRASQIFYSPLVKSPVLFLLSKNDPIGAVSSNLNAKESMESLGMKCTFKCWERSGHVQHLRHHRDEYIKYLLHHLESNVMEQISEKKIK